MTPDDLKARGSAPAETFRVNGGLDRVGIIGSVTRPFCGTCDRVRLTAGGQVRNCLFASTETDLRASLRSGASDGVLRTAAEVMLTIPARHPLSATVGEIRDFFRDDHVHAALIVGPAGYLEAVVERDDIAECQALMLPLRGWDDSRPHSAGRRQSCRSAPGDDHNRASAGGCYQRRRPASGSAVPEGQPGGILL